MSRAEPTPTRVAELPIDLIDLDPGTLRSDFDEGALADLATDIGHRGVEQPITVTPGEEAGRFVLKLGARRLRASQMAGRATIPALLARDCAQGQVARLLDQLAENELREALNPIELAGALRRLRDELKVGVGEIPALLERRGLRAMSRSNVSNTIRLLDLPDSLQHRVASGALGPGHGRALLRAKTESARAAVEAFLEHAPCPTVQELEMLIARHEPPAGPPKRRPRAPRGGAAPARAAFGKSTSDLPNSKGEPADPSAPDALPEETPEYASDHAEEVRREAARPLMHTLPVYIRFRERKLAVLRKLLDRVSAEDRDVLLGIIEDFRCGAAQARGS